MIDNSPQILIVDDDRVNRMLLDTLLKSEGYRTLLAEDGYQAYETALKSLPELILMDVIMPNLDGVESCRKLKGDANTTDIPVIFISAVNDTEDKVRALDTGAVDYVTKPFQKAEVLARVRLHLKLSMSTKAALSAQKQKIEQLRTAQKAILVDPRDMPEAHFATNYIPFHEVGGDFYDVLQVGENLYGYFVADVSGHDFGASFTTPAIKALLKEQASPIYTPVETLKYLNEVLNGLLSDGSHITACYAVLNRSRSELCIVCGAHPGVIYIDKTGNAELIESSGDIIGAFEHVCFQSVKKTVEPGDRFFLYTDGLIEGFGNEKKTRAKGTEDLVKACLETQEMTLEEAVNTICSSLTMQETAIQDDVVLLGVEV